MHLVARYTDKRGDANNPNNTIAEDFDQLIQQALQHYNPSGSVYSGKPKLNVSGSADSRMTGSVQDIKNILSFIRATAYNKYGSDIVIIAVPNDMASITYGNPTVEDDIISQVHHGINPSVIARELDAIVHYTYYFSITTPPGADNKRVYKGIVNTWFVLVDANIPPMISPLKTETGGTQIIVRPQNGHILGYGHTPSICNICLSFKAAGCCNVNDVFCYVTKRSKLATTSTTDHLGLQV